MARKKSAEPAPAIDAATDFAKDEPLHQPPAEQTPEKPKTIDIVLAAIAAGYPTAKVALPWIKQTYDVDMKPGNFSVTKSTIERKGAKAAGAAPAPKRKYTSRAPKLNAPATAPAPAPSSNGHMSPSEAAKAVKQLVDTLGAAEVRNLVELFGG